jgi:hypothetical protein
MDHLARGDLAPLHACRQAVDHPSPPPTSAARSIGQMIQNVKMDDAIYQRVVDTLLGEAGKQISGSA